MKEAVYRPATVSRALLPFSARSVGHYVLREGEGEAGLRKGFVELFWGIRGAGRFHLDGKWTILEPARVCLFLPGDEHRLECVSASWEYRWLTIDGPMCRDVVEQLGMTREPAPSGICPSDLFAKLASEICDHSLRGQRMASATAYSILTEACGDPELSEFTERLVPKCVELIRENFQNNELNVNWLAERLGANRSSLSRIFHEKTGVTIIDYIIASRMQHALFLLKETDMAISEIAYECGYRFPDYFTKAFKKNMGETPREFRGR